MQESKGVWPWDLPLFLTSAEAKQSLPYSGPLHITLCTYLRSKTSKTHNPDSETKAPPSNKQNQNNTNQNYFFFCIFKSRNKEKKKDLFLGLKINKHNELG